MDNLEELEQLKLKYIKAGFAQKNVAGLIDAFVVFTLGILIAYLLVRLNTTIAANDYSSIYFLFYFVIFILYRLISIFLFSGTLGMRTMNLKYANESGMELNKKEKLLAAFMVYIHNIDTYSTEYNHCYE